MILTNEIIESARSDNGGWNSSQVAVLGMNMKSKWKRHVINKDFPKEVIDKFIELRNAHLSRDFVPKKKKPAVSFIPCDINLSWKEQYLHPNWQKMRLFVLNRDKFTCINCKSVHSQLHVHHLKYIKNKFIWDVPVWYLVSLCDACHSEEHNRDLKSWRI